MKTCAYFQAQLYCTLLHVNYLMIKTKTKQKRDLYDPLMVEVSFRTAELERLALHEDPESLTNAQYGSLFTMQCESHKELGVSSLLSNTFRNTATSYIRAFLTHGFSFYDKELPLHLLKCILRVESLEGKEKVEILANAFCHIPYSSRYDVLIFSDNYARIGKFCNIKSEIKLDLAI